MSPRKANGKGNGQKPNGKAKPKPHGPAAEPVAAGPKKHADVEQVVDIHGRNVPVAYRTPQHGHGQLRTGNPGPRDGTLREFRKACQEACSDPIMWQQIMTDLRRAGSRAGSLRAVLLRFGAAYGHGLPPQTFRLTGEEGGPVNLAVVRAELARKIAPPDAPDVKQA